MRQKRRKPIQIIDLNQDSKLKGYIVIHNSNFGPALGGTRIAEYKTSKDALIDATRLAETMAYKCAIVGLPFGGAKGVIINQPGMSREEMLVQYAQQLDKLKGKFYTGEDVGMEEKDVQFMLKISPYFIGKTGQAGDPSYFAALSAFNSLKVALKFLYGSEKITGKTFAVKGAGKTGTFLTQLLSYAGGKVFVSDPDEDMVIKLMASTKNVSVAKEKIEELKVDVLCPCAMGNDITRKNVNKINAKIIVGTANNQLECREVADILFKRGILKIPDYIANAGGLIDVADELMPGGYNRKRVLRSIDNLKDTLLQVLNRAKKEKISPIRVADIFAEKIFKKEKAYVNGKC